MKGYAMLEIGKTGWIEKERPKCGHYPSFGSVPLYFGHSHRLGRRYRRTP